MRGPFKLDRSAYRLTTNSAPLNLTARELALFTHFLDHPNQVFTKAQLYKAAWNNPVVAENAAMVYMNRLRTKVEDDPGAPKFSQTRSGIGYVMVA